MEKIKRYLNKGSGSKFTVKMDDKDIIRMFYEISFITIDNNNVFN